jgi:hypothetical protein
MPVVSPPMPPPMIAARFTIAPPEMQQQIKFECSDDKRFRELRSSLPLHLMLSTLARFALSASETGARQKMQFSVTGPEAQDYLRRAGRQVSVQRPLFEKE